jgi:imidazolonepropionase-like amidohydrolase
MKKNLQRMLGPALGLALLTGWLAYSGFAATGDSANNVKAFIGARIIDGTGKAPLQNATLVVRNGRIEAVGTAVKAPSGAERIDATGKTIIPGMISGHSHVGEAGQLGLYARYGITSVVSLGGDDEIQIRDQVRAEQQTPALNHARLFIAGPVVASKTPPEARKAVDELAAAKTDIVKFRLDDALGAGTKMAPAVYTAIFDEAHKKGMRVAVHVVYLADAKAVLKLGADYIAHSVRDFDIDDETIALLKKNNAFYCPTLTREITTYIFPEKPEFMRDPFLLKGGNPVELVRVKDAAFLDTMRNDKSGVWYKEHLPVAMRNLKKVSDAGVPVVMGTDTGPPARFQGYFEHVELDYMVKSGLTPMQALVAATGTAARFAHASDQIGTLEKGKWADLVMLNANPLDDIRNTEKLDSAWIAGNRVPAR